MRVARLLARCPTLPVRLQSRGLPSPKRQPRRVTAAARRSPRALELLCSQPLAHVLDRGLEQAMHASRVLPSLALPEKLLAPARRDAVAQVVRQTSPAVAALHADVVAHCPEAIAAYDAALTGALAALRAAPLGPWPDLVAGADRLLYADGCELSDDPRFSLPASQHIIDTLHRVNLHAGSYAAWGHELRPWLAPRADAQPPRLVDLAGGTGGFALALKASHGPSIDVVATDLRREYLAIGQREARRHKLAVGFAVQDATDLRSLRAAPVDIFTCTQSVHHFPPGMLARMLGEAARRAERGVCIIDGERGVVQLGVVAGLMALYGRSWPVLHDTIVSLRRMYLAEELELLARLAPGLPADVTVDVGRLPPAHAILTLRRRGCPSTTSLAQ